MAHRRKKARIRTLADAKTEMDNDRTTAQKLGFNPTFTREFGSAVTGRDKLSEKPRPKRRRRRRRR